MKYIKMLFLFVIIMFMSGCAHKISISPDSSMLNINKSSELSGNVGYYFDNGWRDKEVITPGGGGDRVRYTPYSDMKVGYEKILGNVFQNVSQLEDLNTVTLKRKAIDYVISLDIRTNSSSASMFTWPPTWFSVELTSKITDILGNSLANLSTKGEGTAEFSDFIGNKGIAGKIASHKALFKMQGELLNFKNSQEKKIISSSVENENQRGTNVESRLLKINKLFDLGLINKDEFQLKRKEIIKGL